MRYEDPDVPVVVLIGVIGAILLFVITVGAQAFFYANEKAEIQRKVIDRPNEELARVTTEQRQALSSYRWVDQQAGVVTVPVERAAELVLAEQGSR